MERINNQQIIKQNQKISSQTKIEIKILTKQHNTTYHHHRLRRHYDHHYHRLKFFT